MNQAVVRSLPTKKIIPACWVALFIACLPLIWASASGMLVLDHYGFLPVLAILLLLIIAERWDRVWHAPDAFWRWCVLTTAIVLLAVATAFWSPWLGSLAFVLFAGGWLASHEDRTVPGLSLFSLWPATLLMVRLPLGLDNDLTAFLQRLTSQLSSFTLDRLKVPHVLTGNVFELVSSTLMVEEACSGIQSVFALSCCALLLVAYLRRPLIAVPLYLAGAIFWACAANVFRVTTIAVAQDWYGLDLAHGWQHQTLGYVCLLLAIMLLLSTDRLLRVCLFPVPPRSGDKGYNPVVNVWNQNVLQASLPRVHVARNRKVKQAATTSAETVSKLQRYSLATIAAFSMGLLVWQSVFIAQGNAKLLMSTDDTPFWLPPVDLFNRVEGFEFLEHTQEHGNRNLPMGQFADIWTGKVAGVTCRLAISQPYPEPHGLIVCYQGLGWLLNEQQIVDATADSKIEWSCVQAALVNKEGKYGQLLYSCMDEDGNGFNEQSGRGSTRLLQRVLDLDPQRLKKLSNKKYLMLQLWAVSDLPLTPEQVAVIQRVHLQSRTILDEKFKTASAN